MITRDGLTCFSEGGFGEEPLVSVLGSKSFEAYYHFETAIVVRRLQQTLLLPAKPHFDWCFDGFSTC